MVPPCATSAAPGGNRRPTVSVRSHFLGDGHPSAPHGSPRVRLGLPADQFCHGFQGVLFPPCPFLFRAGVLYRCPRLHSEIHVGLALGMAFFLLETVDTPVTLEHLRKLSPFAARAKAPEWGCAAYR